MSTKPAGDPPPQAPPELLPAGIGVVAGPEWFAAVDVCPGGGLDPSEGWEELQARRAEWAERRRLAELPDYGDRFLL